MKNRAKLIACAMAAALLMTACGGASGKGESSAATAAADYAGANGSYYAEAPADYGYALDEEAKAETAAETEMTTEEPVDPVDPVEPDDGEIDPKALAEKLVYTCDISIESLEFEKSAEALRASIKQFGGIISSESTWDNNYNWYYDDYYKRSGTLTLSMTVRVPSGKYQSFLDSLEGIGGKIKNRSMNVQNITKTYNDQTVLIQSLETQEKRLNEMMEKAETIEDMITVEARLTDVQTQLNQARNRLSTMDTDVNYSTINITLTEVVKYTDTTVRRTFAERLAETFGDSWESFLSFLEDLLFAIIYILPYAVVALVIFAVVFVSTKGIRAKAKAERAARKAEKRDISFNSETGRERNRNLWPGSGEKKENDENKEQ